MIEKHIPVMLNDVVAMIGNIQGARVLDATFGAGGYSRRFLEMGANVVAFDRDPNVLVDAELLQHEFKEQFEFVPRPFSAMSELNDKFDAIVFDLGISSMQIDNPERGFSFRFDAPLDMRMSADGDTVIDLIEKSSVGDLTKILRDFGDVRPAPAIARAIKSEKPKTTFELKSLIHNPNDIAPVFQALRIAVNDEIGELVGALKSVPDLLNIGGRCLCVTFHSVEDRIVKNTFRDWCQSKGDPRLPVSTEPRFDLIKARRPSNIEISENLRARSAHLRGVIKLY